MNRSVPSAVIFWPGAPLMVDGVNPRADADITRLRRACRATLDIPGDDRRHVVLVGEGDETAVHEANSWGTLAGFGVDVRIGLRAGVLTEDSAPAAGARILPPALTTGLLMAAAAGARPARVTAVEIDPDDNDWHVLADVIESPGSVVIAVGEGSARSTHSSPGPYTAAGAAADAKILNAIDTADAAVLAAATSAALSSPKELAPGSSPTSPAGDLQMSGLAVWAAVCSILKGTSVESDLPVVHACPFGVEYFVGRWSVGASRPNPNLKGEQ